MAKKRNLPTIGKCFDHLGGRLAPVLFKQLVVLEWIQPKEGRKTIFEPTVKGTKNFKEIFKIDISKI